MHDIKATGFEIDIPLIAYVKARYPTYSHYLESLQASGNLKEITFDSLEKKFAKREKDFGKKTTPQSTEEVACLAQKEKNHAQNSSRERNEGKGKTPNKGKGKAPESAHYIVAHCNTGVTEDLFNASLASWKDDWLLDSGATCHLTFRRDFFEEFTDNVDGAVYFADKSKLKPLGLRTIKLKLLGLPNFLLHDVLYLL
eukprot:PITA_03798